MLFSAKSLTYCPESSLTPLFSELEITIDYGDKIGLAGPNGAGKSSLLHLIMTQRPETGYWKQELKEEEQILTLMECLIRPTKNHWDIRESITKDMGNPSEVFTAWDELMGWELIKQCESLITKVGLNPNTLTLRMEELSHGEKARAWILRFWLYPFDLYLLDEPDNHLDSEGLILLKKWIQTLPAYVVVSHHRGFLDSICNKTWFLKSGKLNKLQASIRVFEVEKSHSNLLQMEKYKKLSHQAQTLEIAAQKASQKAQKMENFKFQRSVSKNGRICKRDEGSGKIVRKDKFQSSASVLKDRAISASHEAVSQKPFIEKQRQIRVCNTRDDTFLVCKNPSLNLRSKDRLRILGNNGSGKSTLLKKLSLNFGLHSEEILRSESAILAYQDQDAQSLPAKGLAWDWALFTNPHINKKTLRTWMGCFGLGSRIESADLSHLSKGERVRLLLSCCLAIQPDILLLDEPVNHLDIEARQLLADGLKDYGGILIFVSHDEDFAATFSDAISLKLPID